MKNINRMRATPYGTSCYPVNISLNGRIAANRKGVFVKSGVYTGFFVLLFVTAAVAEDYLLVTRDEKILQVEMKERGTNTLSYIDRADSAAGVQTRPTSAFDAILPLPQPGKTYSRPEVLKAVDRIRWARSRHLGLMKPLNAAQQEWEGLLVSAPEFEKELAQIRAEFDGSYKDSAAYKRVLTGLEMLKYKDKKGVMAAPISEMMDKANADCVLAPVLARLNALASATDTPLNGYAEARKLLADWLPMATAGNKEKMRGILNKVRLATLAQVSREAVAAFGREKTLEAYLKNRALLAQLKSEVAETQDQKALVDRCVGQMAGEAGKAIKDRSFDADGYPMTAEDRQLLGKASRFCSRGLLTNAVTDEQCLLFPAAAPSNVTAKSISVPLRMVFNSEPPPDRTYGIGFLMNGVKDPFTATVRLDGLTIDQARADFNLGAKFNSLPPSFTLAPDARGFSWMYVYLAYRVEEDVNGQRQSRWVPMSKACAFLIRK